MKRTTLVVLFVLSLSSCLTVFSSLCFSENKHLTLNSTMSPVSIVIPLRVQEISGGDATVYFGVHSNATYCIDPALGEWELPPIPPVGVFEVRLVDPRGFSDCIGLGVNRDLRPYIGIQTDTFQIRFQPDALGGYPFTFSWPNLNLFYSGSVILQDIFGGVLVNIDMKSQTSYTLHNSVVTELRIIASNPYAITTAERITVPLEVSDNGGNSNTLTFGFDTLATYCIDSDLGERLLPPPPPVEVFDVRFIDHGGFNSECLDQGVIINYYKRVPISRTDTFLIIFQPGPGGYPFNFTWQSGLSAYFSSLRIQDQLGGVLINVDMLTNTSLTVSNTGITKLCIIAKPHPFSVLAAPTVTTLAADDIERTSARLKGVVNPNGSMTYAWFEWGLTPSYGNTTLSQRIGDGGSFVNISALLFNLLPNTTYNFRAVAQNEHGTAYGNNQTFTTSDIVPPPSEVSPFIYSVRDVPFDQGGRVSVRWNASSLDEDVLELPFYSIWRALPEGRSAKSLPLVTPADISLTFEGPAYRLIPKDGKDYAWEYIGTQPAHRFSRYSFTAPTLYDSMAGTDGKHYFLVSAHTSDPNLFFDSNIDSGYSVDNLPPRAPRNLRVVYTPEISLYWEKSEDEDVWQYLVYRSAEPNIDISHSAAYANTPHTVFVDRTPPPFQTYYVAVCAQDLRGNIGPKSNEVRITTLGVDSRRGEVPKAFSLAQNYPNPFNPRTTIGFDLSEEGFVMLKVYSPLGQEVRLLVNTYLSAGQYDVPFDGADFVSGVYFYQISVTHPETGSVLFRQMKKLVLVK